MGGVRWPGEGTGGASGRYILDERHQPQPCEDLMTWARFMEKLEARRVAETFLPDGSRVSTMFLGIDHGFVWLGVGGFARDPILFETMVFQGRESLCWQDADGEETDHERYATWDEAERGHREIVAKWEAELAKRVMQQDIVVDLGPAEPGEE